MDEMRRIIREQEPEQSTTTSARPSHPIYSSP
jgi:hypothetical protein